MGHLTTEESEPAWAAGPPDDGGREARPGPMRWIVALVALALVAAGAGVWLLNTSDEDEAAPAPEPTDTATRATGADTDEFASTLAGTLTLTSGEVKCVRDRVAGQLEEDRVLQLVTTPEPTSPDQATLDQVLTGCSLSAITAAEAPAAAGASEEAAPVERVFTFGDDAELDQLWEACASQAGAFCDELYNRAPEGSEYEAFADTCGGRGAPQVACAPDALAQPGAPGSSGGSGDAGALQKYGDNPEFDRLWDQCAAGDGQACLALAFQAPAGSEYARFGESCGNRPDDPACGAG